MLTKKQRLFCEEYIKDYNAKAAYGRVYGNNSGNIHRLFKSPEVVEYIKELQTELTKQAVITGNKVLITLDKMANDPLVANKDRLKALDLIQKQLGLQKQVVQNDTISIEVKVNEDKPDAE